MTMSAHRSEPTKQLFLSYSNADRKIARSIAEELRRHGVRVWFDDYELKVGDSIAKRIDEAISSSDYLMVILSPNSVKSRWVQEELNAAFARELSNRDITILPVLVSDCEIPSFLASRVFIDLRRDFVAGIATLVRQMGIALNIDFSQLNPLRFEALVADLFRSAGFSEVQVGSAVRDRAVDIVARYPAKDPFGMKRDEVWLVEVKFYRKERADLQALRRFIGYLTTMPGGYRGVLVTNGQLTSATREWLDMARKAGRVDLRVIDGTELRRLLLQNPDIATKYFPSEKAK